MLSLATSLPPFTLTGDFAGKSLGAFGFMAISPIKWWRVAAFRCDEFATRQPEAA